jgi:hypothetical protein
MAKARAAARGLDFGDVRRLVARLQGVEESTAYGSPCLKVGKTMFACIAINKQAEPNTLMIRMPIAERDEIIAAQPEVYYLKPHYEPWPCLLVRLDKVHPDALKDLLTGAWRRASQQRPRRVSSPSRRPTRRRAAP